MNKQEIEKDIEILKYYEAQDYFFSKDMPALHAFRRAVSCMEQQLTNGWIPVSERLPEPNNHVLTCTKFGEIAIEYYCNYLEGFTDKTFPNGNDISYTVIAWRPLPEPYKEVYE